MSDKPHGGGHWLLERLTSIALIPLCLWAVWAVIAHHGMTHAEFVTWLSVPMNAWLMIALVVIGFWHGVMGGQVIAEDYISTLWVRTTKIILMKVFCIVLAVLSLLAVHHIAF